MLPRGVVVRDQYDFAENNRAVCGCRYNIFPSVNGFDKFVTLSLFNNDNQSRDLTVYGWDGYNDAAIGGDWDYFMGSFGVFQQNASPLRAGDPMPPGQCFFKETDVVIPPINQTNPDITKPIGSNGWSIANCNQNVGHPLWIIPPGFSLRFGSVAETLQGGITWWYVYE